MKNLELANDGLHITEGVSGTYYYHLSEANTDARSLCGVQTMATQMPLASWGVRGHLNEKWCANCATMGFEALRLAGAEVMNERDALSVRLLKLKYRMEEERKTGKGIWSQAEKFLDRLGTPGELPEDIRDAHAFLARHNA